MISRYVISILCIVSAVAMSARDDWYDRPVVMEPGYSEIGDMDNRVEHASVHVRIAADHKGGVQWGLLWNYLDALNHARAFIAIPKADNTEYIYKQSPVLTVEQVADGCVTKIFETALDDGFDCDGRFNSLKLTFDDGEAALFCGNGNQSEITQVPFDVSGGKVLLYNSDKVQCQRIQCVSASADAHPMSEYTDKRELIEHIKHSADVNEGVWEYLDRNIDTKKAIIGGFYDFATVSRGDGYDIVYLNGADVNRGQWQPLMIKGYLKPTIFEGNFDMVWIDADCRRLTEDVNAQLSDDASILTLRFPVLDAELRFRRKALR